MLGMRGIHNTEYFYSAVFLGRWRGGKQETYKNRGGMVCLSIFSEVMLMYWLWFIGKRVCTSVHYVGICYIMFYAVT